MAHKNSLHLVIILLGLSLVFFSVVSVPTTRSLSSNTEETSIQTIAIQDEVEFRNGEEMFDMGAEEFMLEGRMNLERLDDYPGTGANNRHDPKSPGKA